MGCSTFDNSTVYMNKAKGLDLVNYRDDAVDLTLQFNPDVNFASAGVLGAPVIPLYIKIRKVKEVILGIELSAFQNKFFSVNTKPCLRVNDNEEFCPEHLSVSAMGMRDIGSIEPNGHTWVDACDFRNSKDISIDLINVSEINKIDRNKIFQHYDCADEERLDYLLVYYVYTYKCHGECPKKIILNVKNIIYIDGLPIEDHNYIFERTLKNKYVAMWSQLQ